MRAFVLAAALLALTAPALAQPQPQPAPPLTEEDAQRMLREGEEQGRRNQGRWRREAEEARRRENWQVVRRRTRECVPLTEWILGARDPGEAMAAIQLEDPEALFDRTLTWPSDLPVVQIYTSTGDVVLTRNFNACVNLFRLERW